MLDADGVMGGDGSMADVPCTPKTEKVFMSAWIPAPPPESDPPIVRVTSLFLAAVFPFTRMLNRLLIYNFRATGKSFMYCEFLLLLGFTPHIL